MSNFDPREHLSAYIDGELSGSELEQFNAALASDGGLQEELDALQQLITEVASLPQVEAPAGLAPAVLERVASLAIPGSAGSAAPAAERTAEVATEAGQLADIPRIAFSAITGNESVAGFFRMLGSSMWFKVPAGAGVAALMALGLSYMSSPSVVQPPRPQLAQVAPASEGVAPSEDSWSDASDGVVEADLEAKPEEIEDEAPELLERPPVRVRSGGSVPKSEKTKSSRKRKRRRAPKSKSVVGEEGVLVAEWEELDSVDDTTMAGEPIRDYVDPAGDGELVARSDRTRARREAGGSPAPAPPGVASSLSRKEEKPVSTRGLGARSAEAEDLDEESAEEAPPPASNTLRLASEAKANALVKQLREKDAWSVKVTRRDGYFKLKVTVPSGQYSELLEVLKSSGGSLSVKKHATPGGAERQLSLQLNW